MNTTNYIKIFRGDDSDALGYQTIVGTIKTDLDLAGCKAVFRFLGFYAEFDPIPEDKKLTIVIPAQASRGFPPGVGYASLKVFDSLGKIRTFTNRIPVIVDTMTPSCGCGEFEVSFSPFPELEPLKIFVGPNPDDLDQYTGFLSKIIDRASLVKYGLVVLADAMGQEGGVSGKAASPLAVKTAYDAIIKELTDNYYTAAETDEAINSVTAYYITRNAAGNAFDSKAQLESTTVFYSGGKVRVPTRNDYCVVLSDETHDNAEYRYIYAVAEGQTTGSWEAQYPVGGTMTIVSSVTKNSPNPVTSSGIWSALWGALSALPTGFLSFYDWCVAQLAPKVARTELFPAWAANTAYTTYSLVIHDNAVYKCTTAHTSGAEWDSTKWAVATGAEVLGVLLNYLALSNKPQINGHTLTGESSQSGDDLGLLDLAGGAMTGQLQVFNLLSAIRNVDSAGAVSGARFILRGTTNEHYIQFAYQDDKYGLFVKNGPFDAGTFYPMDNIAAVPNKADVSAIPYSLGTPIVINSASSEVVEGETVNYGAAALANRTANIVQVTAATALDELHITFPAATSGKVRDFGLRVEIGTGSAALAAPALVPIAPTGETIKLENADGTIPALADGTATAKGVTLLYFSETAPGVFVVKGEQVEEVA